MKFKFWNSALFFLGMFFLCAQLHAQQKMVFPKSVTSVDDLKVKVLGGVVRIERTWSYSARKWVWNSRWANIRQESMLSLKKNNLHYVYTHTQDGQMVFRNRFGQTISKSVWAPAPRGDGESDHIVWSNRNGDKVYFSQLSNAVTPPNASYIESYENKNGVKVFFEKGENQEIAAIKDHLGNVILTYQWETTNQGSLRLKSVTDYTGRKVIYTYHSDSKIASVTDVRGELWKYEYGSKGELIAQINPDGVKEQLTDNTNSLIDIVYDSASHSIKVSEKSPSGSVTEKVEDYFGNILRKTVNGELQFAAEYAYETAPTGMSIKQYYTRRLAGLIPYGDAAEGREYCELIGAESLFVFTGATYHWSGCTYSRESSARSKSRLCPYDGCENSIAIAAAIEQDEANPLVPRLPAAKPVPPYLKTKIITNSFNNKTTYEYDQWKNKVKTTYADGTSISRTWHDKYKLPLTETNEKGIVTAYDYDAKGNLLTLTEAKGTTDERITRYTYDEYGQLKTKTTGESAANNTALATTHYDYDQYGNITKVTDPEGDITTYSDYDALGNAKIVTDGRSNLLPVNEQYTWKNTYDNAGNALTRHDPYGKGETYTYNKIGHLESITSASGSKVTLTTNANGQPLTMTDDNGKITKIEYDKAGRLTFTTDANGNKTQTIYDVQGRLLRTVDGEGNTTQLNYSEHLLRSIQYPTYKEVFEYDNRNRVKQTTQQANNRNYLRKRGYDLSGSLTTSTDAQIQETVYGYDALNRVKTITDAEGGVTEFAYDARDNLLQVKDPEGRLTIYTYDKIDRQLSETKDGDENTNKQRRYGYDQNNNLTRSINPAQEKMTYEFDQANRLVKTKIYANKDHNHPIKVISYSFNENNHLTGWNQQASETLPEGVTPTADVISLSETYSYNNLELLESVAVNFGAFTKTYSYTYYPNGLKKTYTNPENITYTYYYNKNNQLMAVHIPGEGQISWAEFSWMVPQTLLLPGGQKISLKYDDFQQMEERVLRKADNTELAKAVYEYDLEQNIKKIEKGEGIFNYNYDSLHRLTTADSPEGYAANDETFDYDGVGNRVSRTENGASESQNYNQKNQLQAIDSSDNTKDVTYTYNANGHTETQTKNGVVTEYIYNHEERLIAVKRDGNTVADYAYNPHGQRVKKSASGITTWYFYNENGLAAEYSSSGQLLKEYHFHPQKTWMTDPLFQRTIAGELYYYHNDHLGTPQQMVDATGNIVWSAQYAAFGKTHVIVNIVENNLRFPGQYFDEETGLHQNYFRDYDIENGRYLQQDPLGIASSINYYAYAYQNPLSFTDPTGEIVPIAAALVRCVLQCVGISYAAHRLSPNPDPCFSMEDALKACGLECLNPLNWLGGGYGGRPPVMPLRNGGRNTHTAAGEQYGSYTVTYPDGTRYHGKGPESRARQSATEHGVGGTYEWKDSKNEREAFKDESRRMDQDRFRHKDPNNHNKNASPGDKYREQDGEVLPGGGGSNFNEPGGRPGGKPGGGSGGDSDDDCCG